MTDLSSADAVLFDLDGVLTATAEVHERAWEALFTDLFSRLGVTPPYSEDDYLRYVDGRPRYEGVRAVLRSRGISLPEGKRDDPAGESTVCALGNEKNALFAAALAKDGVAAYPGSVALVDALELAGVPTAVVSSSRNAHRVLEAAGLAGRFSIVVDGETILDNGLVGKPTPDTYLWAARLLNVPPARAAVIEDAIAGVAAGHAGGFSPVIGVDRGATRSALLAAGADLVVDDLAELIPAVRGRQP